MTEPESERDVTESAPSSQLSAGQIRLRLLAALLALAAGVVAVIVAVELLRTALGG